MSTCSNLTHRATWAVDVRQANYSAFNGYHRTVSDYSQVRCRTCGATWRTKAAYVAALPDTTAQTEADPTVDIEPAQVCSYCQHQIDKHKTPYCTATVGKYDCPCPHEGGR